MRHSFMSVSEIMRLMNSGQSVFLTAKASVTNEQEQRKQWPHALRAEVRRLHHHARRDEGDDRRNPSPPGDRRHLRGDRRKLKPAGGRGETIDDRADEG